MKPHINTDEAVSLIGTISCKAALESSRFQPLCLMVDPKKRSREFAYIIALAKQQNIRVEMTDASILDQTAKGHGGIILEVLPKGLPSIMKLDKAAGLCVYLDGVEDPYNLGSCLRSLYAAGVSSIILPERNWDRALPVIMRASAGAYAKADLYTAKDEKQFLRWIEQQQCPVICAWRGAGSQNCFEYAWPKQCILVIGGALRGISSAVLSAANQTVHIPYGRDFRNALDTPAAAAVLGFAWMNCTANYAPNSAEE